MTWLQKWRYQGSWGPVVVGIVSIQSLLFFLLAILVLSALPYDTIELFSWDPWQLGYWKHPPLPTWCTALFIHGIGSLWGGYVLSLFQVGVYLLGIWVLARQVLDPQRAWMAVLLGAISMHTWAFSFIVNHNSFPWALFPWFVWFLICIQQENRWKYWCGASCIAVLMLLSKYASLVLIGVGGILMLCHQPALLRSRYLYWALILAMLLLSPHLVWGALHGFPPMTFLANKMHARVQMKDWISFFGLPILSSVMPWFVFRNVGGSISEWLIRIRTDWRCCQLTRLVWIPWFSSAAVCFLMRAAVYGYWSDIFTPLFPVLLASGVPKLDCALTSQYIRKKVFCTYGLGWCFGACFLGIVCHTSLLSSVGDHIKQQLIPNDNLVDLVPAIQQRWNQAQAEEGGKQEAPSLIVASPIKMGHVRYGLGNPPMLLHNDIKISPWVRQEILERGNILLIDWNRSTLQHWTMDYPNAKILEPIILDNGLALNLAIVPSLSNERTDPNEIRG